MDQQTGVATGVNGLYVAGWNPTFKIVRSHLDGTIWVPRSVLADDITVTEYAGHIDVVKQWAEMTVMTMGIYYSHPIASMRWRCTDDDTMLLEVQFKEH